MADIPESPTNPRQTQQRLCWWRDPEHYDFDGLPKEKTADSEARYGYEEARAELQFTDDLDALKRLPPWRDKLLVTRNLEKTTRAFLHHALIAFADFLLDQRTPATEALRAFDQLANERLAETFNHKWLPSVRHFRLTEDESSEKQFWALGKEAVEYTRQQFERLLWKAELEEAASPVARDGAPKSSGNEPARTEAGPAGNETNDKAVGPIPQFPKRASWLRDRLRERSWNKHDLSRHGGPDHKTVQKILDGFSIREDVLQKVADGLSKRECKVNLLDIPQD